MDNEERTLIVKKSSFPLESEYFKEISVITKNLLSDTLRRVGITIENLNDTIFINKYKVGKDTFLPYSDHNKKLEVYCAFGIRLLDIETNLESTRFYIPVREPLYSRSIGEENTKEYIPSTIAFIRDYKPESGYNGDLGKRL